jgi:hypothetical protein
VSGGIAVSVVYKSLEHHLDELRKKYADAVDSIVQDAIEASEDGTYPVDFADVPGDFNMREDRYLISEMLCERDEIIAADVHGYGFDLELDSQYCKRMAAGSDEADPLDEDEFPGIAMQ